MGGAVGHLMHLYDNPDLTFGEIKEIVQAASEGKLEKVSEKLDGLNLVFTWDESAQGLRVARNSGDIKSGGMDAGALAAKFADRGNLSDAFNSAYKVLNQALGALPSDARTKVFGPDGRYWYSMELVYSANPNVIQYDGNNVVFHGWPVFKAMPDGTVQKGPGGGVDVLTRYLEKMQGSVKEKDWKVRGPALVAMKKISDGSVAKKAVSRISAAMSAAGVKDTDTMEDYLTKFVLADAQAKGIYPPVVKAVAMRIAGVPGAPNLNDIKKKLRKEDVPKVQEYVKNGPKLLKQAVAPIEQAIHEFAVEVLRGLSSTLISKNDAEIDRLRSTVRKAADAIQSSGNEQAMSMLATQMQKLGGYENLAAAMEGVVFIYKGNAYKFTGAFAPVNQILGLFKYGRGKVKIASESVEFLRKFIVESLVLEDNEEDYAERERIAKARYDNALARKAAFEKHLKGKSNFIAAMKAAGYDALRDSDRNPTPPVAGSKPATVKKFQDIQKIKKDPNNQYELKWWNVNALPKDVTQDIAVATKNFRSFDPSIVGYSHSGTRKVAVADDKDVEKFDKKVIMPITKVKPLQWYAWEQFGKGLPDYGSTVDDEADEERADVGVGPGEERLEYIFGGNVKGGSVSYDVVTPDKRKWEVKALESPSSTIRPGTEGKAAVAPARERLASIMKQLKNFVVVANKQSAQGVLDEESKKIIRYIGEFVANENEEIVGKGEVTSARFDGLYGALKLVNRVQEKLTTSGKETPTVVGLNDKKIKVDKPTFLDVAKTVKKATGNQEVLKPFEVQELIMSTLKDPAFKDPQAFMREFRQSIRASQVFRQVDGVFIVSRRLGFNMVPKSEFDNVFKFFKISQAAPRFKYTLYAPATSK